MMRAPKHMSASTETVDIALSDDDAAPTVLPAGTLLSGRYEILRLLGSGGSARVYAVNDRVLRKRIAVKLLRRERVNEQSLARLRREVRLAREAGAPRLVRVFDVDDKCIHGPFITMELIEGETLRARLKRAGLSIDDVVRIAGQTAEALESIHRLGIVHRDVKPSNLLIDTAGEVKLADFGLAIRYEPDLSRLTATAAIIGTLEYLSPEQALGEDLDPRTDLYSLGVVLFEMLTGRLPFSERSSIGTIIAQIQQRAPDVRQLRPDTPRWLSRLVARLLERDRARRVQSAAELAAILRAKHLRWRPRIESTAMVILAVALIGGGAGWWTYQTRFAKIVNGNGNGTIAAFDRRGRILWSIPDPKESAESLMIRTADGPRLAVIRDAKTTLPLPMKYQLLLIDPQTGRTARNIHLESRRFAGFSSTFGVDRLARVDLDHDGNDELVVSFMHATLYPSYSLYVDPAEEKSRVIFIASGHHRVAGEMDIDGDGRDELLFTGINNAMGWYSAAAAVVVPPLTGDSDALVAETPDLDVTSSFPPLWYALLPRGYLQRSAADIDRTKRRITFHYDDGRSHTIDFAGFNPLQPSPMAAGARNRIRVSAYAEVREAKRLAEGGFTAEALQHARHASEIAPQSHDAFVAEWVSRELAGLLVRAGQVDEAEALFGLLSATSEARSEIAFDAGRELAIRGELTRAVSWYRRGLGPSGDMARGRGRYEFLEGAVLSLVQLGRLEEAREETARFSRAFPTQIEFAQWFLEYIDWRAGRPRLIQPPLESTPDIIHYTDLEVRAATGTDPRALLARLDELDKRLTSVRGPRLSLRAELLERAGRSGEAFTMAAESLESARLDSMRDTESRALYDLVAQRFIRIATNAGHGAEAASARVDLDRFRGQNR